MTTVVLPSSVYMQDGAQGVVRYLRQNGIPVRRGPNLELRLCQEWSADGKRCLGYGKLEWNEDGLSGTTVFRYTRPGDENVIDVEAREVSDAPRLT